MAPRKNQAALNPVQNHQGSPFLRSIFSFSHPMHVFPPPLCTGAGLALGKLALISLFSLTSGAKPVWVGLVIADIICRVTLPVRMTAISPPALIHHTKIGSVLQTGFANWVDLTRCIPSTTRTHSPSAPHGPHLMADWLRNHAAQLGRSRKMNPCSEHNRGYNGIHLHVRIRNSRMTSGPVNARDSLRIVPCMPIPFAEIDQDEIPAFQNSGCHGTSSTHNPKLSGHNR